MGCRTFPSILPSLLPPALLIKLTFLYYIDPFILSLCALRQSPCQRQVNVDAILIYILLCIYLFRCGFEESLLQKILF